MKSSGIGGQAVLEGVMMRNKSDYAVAVRKPDGEIAVSKGKFTSIAEKGVFFRLPIIRGVVAFIESMIVGIRTLNYSASFYEEEEEKKLQKKLTKEQQEKRDGVMTGLTVAFSVIIAFLVFVILPYVLARLLQTRIQSEMVLGLIEGLLRVVLFVGYVFAISFMSDIRRTFMYHGAEHKCINCIENGFELTVENVRRQSKHHRRCGTSFLFLVIFLSIIFIMFINPSVFWLRILSRILLVPVIAGISYEFILFAGNSDNKFVEILCKPGMLLQMLTTREPDNKMIEVAIVSIEEVFDWKEYQRRAISAKKTQAKFEQGRKEGRRKSRAELAEELRKREEENARRANERAKRIMEQERKEAELEKIATEAEKRKSKREAMEAMKKEQNEEQEGLNNLDHFFEKEKNKEEKQ